VSPEEQEVPNMETPLQVELHDVKSSDYVHELIESNLAKIEKRFGRATACRVVVHAPNAHHKSGEPFGVTIRMALPAKREIYVDKSSDERGADMTFAINDAFKRALRQLDTEADHMQGHVKYHATGEA
jgi:ribosome-associated translation inhibitor RaiA